MTWKRIGGLIAAAAGVVGAVLGLFGSVFSNLTPPTSSLSPTLFAGIASLAALLVLLVIVLALPARPSTRQRHAIAGFSGAAGLAAFLCLFIYLSEMNTYVFEYAAPGEKPSRHVRGELTSMGESMVRDMTVAGAVARVGGLRTAETNQLLWSENSRKQIEFRLLLCYVAAVTLFCTALFSLAVTLIAARRAG